MRGSRSHVRALRLLFLEPPEAIQYAQWEQETHLDHIDFTVRSDADMYAYWKWRHKPERYSAQSNGF
jgi:hypothetical protein